MAVTYIDIPVGIEDLGPEGTAEDVAQYVAVFGPKVQTAFPEAQVKVYAGRGFSTLYADSEQEEREASDYIAQLGADAQVEMIEAAGEC